jgi:mono/diheme cytochrome c family protein
MRSGIALASLLMLFAPITAPLGHADDDATAAEIALGRTLFKSVMPSCSTCHALQAVEATGAVGPSLDELQPDAARVETALREGLNAMPSYADSLSDAQIRALARFIDAVT